MTTVRLLVVGAATFAAQATLWATQSDVPTLTQQQQTLLRALVSAVDARTAEVSVADEDWPVHVLRASDGSHYVAFSIHQRGTLISNQPVMLYVRLATRSSVRPVAAERSAVAEWLTGQTPTPVLPRRGLAFGEMPIYGAAGIAQRGAALQAQNLQILELERERAREKREAQERARRAALEGEETHRTARPLLPFEDFDLNARPTIDSSGTPVLRRSLTAGPGDYELILAWTAADARTTSQLVVARRRLSLPPASTTALALSSVLVAEEVSVRDIPIPASQQAADPYSIGGTVITPAPDHVLNPEERLALLVQVINPRGAATGKPDVEVGFRIYKREGTREANIGALAPQSYNEQTLPADFDVTKGHPLFAAVAIPLRTFKRGEYRVEIAANDRVAGLGVTSDTRFTVTATPAALLREAPSLAPGFNPAKEALTADVSVIRGGVHASDGHDREAIVAWQAAIDAGVASAVVWPLMIDAALRLGDTARAIQFAEHALAAAPNHARTTRQLAAALIMAGKRDAALQVLESHLQKEPADVEAQWIALHALFAGFVAGEGSGATEHGRRRIAELARDYAAANGPHAALALDWAAAAR